MGILWGGFLLDNFSLLTLLYFVENIRVDMIPYGKGMKRVWVWGGMFDILIWRFG